MSLIYRFMASRVLVTVLIVVTVFFGIIALVESLDGGRYSLLTQTRDENIARFAIVFVAARWSIKTLPVTVLIGGIVALLNLQTHRELLIFKASGYSIWQIAAGPVVALLVLSGLLSTVIEAQVTQFNRFILPAGQSGFSNGLKDIWLEQSSREGRYILSAKYADADKQGLRDVVVFLGPNSAERRVEAKSARLTDGAWLLADAKISVSNRPAQIVERYRLETNMKTSDLNLKLSSTEDFTLYELAGLLASGVTDPQLYAAAATRFSRLMAMPLLLVGTLLIAFAFTAGYRRTGSYGSTIVYGIVMGFVMFVVNEMSDRAGSVGILSPTLAAWGPAVVAVIIGLTVLLYKEDGRA